MGEPGFMLQEAGKDGLVGIFEDDGETGWLYLYDSTRAERGENGILVAAPAYNRDAVQPEQGDVRLVWSGDFSKCAVLVRGAERPIIDDFRAIINVLDGRFAHKLFDGRSLGIQDSNWLESFEWTWASDSV